MVVKILSKNCKTKRPYRALLAAYITHIL